MYVYVINFKWLGVWKCWKEYFNTMEDASKIYHKFKTLFDDVVVCSVNIQQAKEHNLILAKY